MDAYLATLSLENRRSADISIRDFKTSCDCTSVEPKSLVIPAGQRREVRLRVNLTHRSPFQLGAEKRALGVALIPTFESQGTSRSGWQLTGTVQSRVVLESHLLQFGTMSHRGDSPVTRKVTARLPEPDSTLAVRVLPPIARAEVVKTPGPDSTAYELRVTPNTDIPLGKYRFSIATHVTDAAGVAHVGPSIDVGGEMMPNRMVWPGNVYFDDRTIGDTVSTEVTVDDGATVRKITHDSPGLAVTKKQGAGPTVYTIAQRVTSLGERVSIVTFQVSQPDGSEAESTVSVRYVGVPTKGRR